MRVVGWGGLNVKPQINHIPFPLTSLGHLRPLAQLVDKKDIIFYG